MKVKEWLNNAKLKCKKAAKVTADWVEENASAIVAFGVYGATIAGFIGWMVYLSKNNTITVPTEIVRFSNGWMLLDAYEPNLYWPTTHGLSIEEIQEVGKLIEEENISTGEALARLGLLRANC